MSESSTVTPEIQAVMADRARLRAECEAEMLKHFLEVSRTMPPEQGRRYLAWVQQLTILRGNRWSSNTVRALPTANAPFDH
jgi:hypothetical protein